LAPPELPPLFGEALARARGKALLITRNNLALGERLRTSGDGLDWNVVSKQEVGGWSARRLVALLRSEPRAFLVIEDRIADLERRRDLYRLLLLLGRGRERWILGTGPEGVDARRVSGRGRALGMLLSEGWSTARGLLSAGALLRKTRSKPLRPPVAGPLPESPRVAYLKTDFWFGVKAGGSVSHAVGVLGGFRSLGFEPRVWTSAALPGLPAGIAQTEVPPPARPSLVEEAAMAAFNRHFLHAVEDAVRAFDPTLIYQRHGVFSLAGLAIAQRLGVPLILEVNSSEVWAREAWSRLYFAGLARSMERTAFERSERLVLISKALIPTVSALGGDERRMVVNPNGVAVDRFDPEDRAQDLRAALGVGAKDVLCAFLGTFTTWHGVLFLAEQVPDLLRADRRLHVLFLGDGDRRAEVQQRLERDAPRERVHFTGLVPPERIPRYLAACDILLSPHLPFEDGSEFFGSPTKLFEYMAAGRAVVASRLGQIGDVVEDGKSGILYPPGNGERFAAAVKRLADHAELRHRLGKEARRVVASNYTWEANVGRAVAGLVPDRSGTDG